MIEVRKHRGHGRQMSSSVYIRTTLCTFEIYRADISDPDGKVVYGTPVRCEWSNIETARGLSSGNRRWTPWNDGPLRDFLESIQAEALAKIYAGIDQ